MADSVPKTMKAITSDADHKASVKNDVSVPGLRDEYLLVKTRALALNPTDWKHVDSVIEKPDIKVGCDYSGDVVAVGSKVTKGWKVGDRVAGFAHGGNNSNPEDGAFSDYLVSKADVQIKVPDSLSYEDAATLGVGVVTTGQGLYQTLQLPWPNQPSKEKFPVLVYGGSTATGALAIQLLKLSGLEVYTTCSPHNNDYVKSLGADHVFDYSSPSCGADIRKATNDSLYYAQDTIAEKDSFKICCDALSSHAQPDGKKPQYCATLPVEKFPRDDVEHASTLGYTAMGEAFSKFGQDFPAMPDNFEFQKKWIAVVDDLLAGNKLKPHRLDVRKGSLDSVMDGLQEYREGKVSGKKLVYSLTS